MKIRTDIKAGKGLGDYVADFTQATGLDKVADKFTELTGKACGCEERKEALNKLAPNLS